MKLRENRSVLSDPVDGSRPLASRPVGVEVFYWLARWSDDQTAVFGKVAEAGYDGVEISLMASADVDAVDIARAAGSAGIAVVCSTGLTPETDISSADPAVRTAGRQHLRRCLDCAAELGSPVLGGVTYAPWMSLPDGDLSDYRKRSAASLSEVAEHASVVGVDICLEVLNRFESSMFNTVAECLAFADLVGHPAVKVQVDTFHMNMEEDDLADAIRLAAGRLAHVQVAANNRRAPQFGHIDWPRFRQALDDVRYTGWIVFETFPNPTVETGRSTGAWRSLSERPDVDVRDAAAFIRKHLS